MIPAHAATTFTATFTPTASNAWWVQVKVDSSATLTGVDARVDGGAWKPLTLRSYGWAASMSAPEGSTVQFQAKSASGSLLSGCYRWTSRAPVACPGATTSTTTATTASTVSFTPKGGNEWWVQVAVTGSPLKVEARDTNGAWVALVKKSWGDWAAGFHVEPGNDVQYRATTASGVTASCWYDHPRATCASGSATTTTSTTSGTTSTTSLLWSDSFAASPWTGPWKIVSSWGISNTDTLRDSTGQTFMRVTYPAGGVGEGAEWKGKPFTPRESVHLRYDVRFPTGFDFVRGGKLPGLYGGTGNSGGNIPDGTDGWSTRLMWRADGKGEVYAYLPTSETWGTRIGTGNWDFAADGQWHTVEQKVTLNTIGSRNGEIKIWYDGVEVVHATGLTFRTTSTLKVDGVFFSTFFGGNDASWAPPRTVHADFTRFAASTSYIGR